MRPPRLPIPVPPAQHETLASYLARLAGLHGMAPRDLWEPISTPRPGTARRDVLADRLAALTGRPREHLAGALPELRDPQPDWSAWRHQPQPGCLRCDARHEGGAVARLLPHHRYVCTRHRYWIGPPDAGQPATALGDDLDEVVRAQRRHLRLLRRHGPAATFDAVLTGFLVCGHLWDDRPEADTTSWQRRWERRTKVLIPVGAEAATFSAFRLFAAVYPEAVALATVIASPTWRQQASGTPKQQQRFLTQIGRLLDRQNYQPPDAGDAITHWMKYDSHRPPSRPEKIYPDTRQHGALGPTGAGAQSRDRTDRSAYWFGINRRGGTGILHHRHIRPVLVRDWSPRMDGITATIFASKTTIDLGRSTLLGHHDPGATPDRIQRPVTEIATYS
jgi:hypothetical protein